jgi:outer membrane protein OmpA-like peptidoglycan-associated protein
MKSIILTAAFIAAIVCSPRIASAQQYYVVIGAFATEGEASEFKGYLPIQSVDTSYTVREKADLLQLYVLKTSDKAVAIEKTNQLKKEIESLKTSGDSSTVHPQISVSGADLVITQPSDILQNETTRASGAGSDVMANAGSVPLKPKGKFFKFVIETPEGNAVPGQLHHVDYAKGKEVATYNSNTFVDLLQPAGNSASPMAVVCGMFGYKEIEKYIDYRNPSLSDEQAYVDSHGTWVIPYVLEPVEKGDVSVMYNVSFYKDAVVMRGQSKVDLDQLVNMMRTNPYYEITIHAHCNGKNKREAIALGPNRNYFDVTGSTTVNVTAKALTTLRAEAIRSYLADQGIDPARAKIFSWGGSDMLVKETSPESNLNDRIEIEITRD